MAKMNFVKDLKARVTMLLGFAVVISASAGLDIRAEAQVATATGTIQWNLTGTG